MAEEAQEQAKTMALRKFFGVDEISGAVCHDTARADRRVDSNKHEQGPLSFGTELCSRSVTKDIKKAMQDILPM